MVFLHILTKWYFKAQFTDYEMKDIEKRLTEWDILRKGI